MKRKAPLLAALLSALFLVVDAQPPPRLGMNAVPFSDFAAKIDIEDNEFEIRGSFTLGAASDGVNLFREDVFIKVGAFSTTIPAGSFQQEAKGKVSYKGRIGDIDLDVYFLATGKGRFRFKVEGEGANRTGRVRLQDVAIRIGDDGGVATKPER